VRNINFDLAAIDIIKNKDYIAAHLTMEKGDREFNDYIDPEIWPKRALVKRWYLPRQNKRAYNMTHEEEDDNPRTDYGWN